MNKNTFRHAAAEFEVNDFMTLRLDGISTVIYIDGEEFEHCKFLLVNLDGNELDQYDEIESIDDAAEKLDNVLETPEGLYYNIPPDVEFWGHCSNLQAWAEHDYDTRLIHSNLAFPLLKKLTEVGDPVAKNVFKEEVAKRFVSGNEKVITFMLRERFLRDFTSEELVALFQDVDLTRLDEKSLFSLLKKYPSIWKNIPEVEQFLRQEYCHGKHVIVNSEKHFVQFGELRLRKLNIKDFSEIKGLDRLINLRRLNLHGNEISEIKGLKTLRHLRTLSLTSNKIKQITGLEQLTKLEGLYLEWNQIEEINGLESLENLQQLDLRGNNIKEIKGLERLARLRGLYLNENKIEQIDGLTNLSNLTTLDLGDNQIKEIRGLESLDKLFSFNLTENKIKDVKGLESLVGLVHLDIGYNNIPQELVEELGGMKSLESARVKNARVWVEYCKNKKL